MDLKLALCRTIIKSGERSMVKNQSFKARQVDVTAKFSMSLKTSIYRDEDLENKKKTRQHTKAKANTLCKTSKTKHQQLREFLQ